MPTGFENLYTSAIRPYLDPAVARLNEWKVPHQEIRDKVTKLALPQIKLIAWLALVMGPAPSVMIASAALVFVFEPWLMKRFPMIKNWLSPDQEGRPQTNLEAFAGTFFNYRDPEITEIEAKLVEDSDNSTLKDRLSYLNKEDNMLSAGQQTLFFGASLVVAHLLPGPLLYPFAIIFGGLVGDHLYRASLRSDAIEDGAEPVYGYETLIQDCTKTPENPPAPAIEWTFAYAWTLLSEHANPLLEPITKTCESNDIPLIQLVRKTHALVVAKVKCIACIACLTLASPAPTLPYVTVLVASIWLIFDSLGEPFIDRLSTNETYLEGCVRFFDNEKISVEQEKVESARVIELLKAQHQSNETAIKKFEQQNARSDGSVGGDYEDLIAKRTTQILTIENALKAYEARSSYLEKQKPRAPTSIERQAAIFATAYLAAKLIGHFWIYYGIVSIGGGVLLGNHAYHWAKREDDWETVE